MQMQMTGVLESFRELSGSPVAWVILAAAALRACWSLVVFFRCPIARQNRAFALMHAERDLQAVRSLHVSSPRFLATMLAGIALSVGGLYALARPEPGSMALAAILFGAFLLIVEPSRLSVEENTRRASAARLGDAESEAFAMERLRAAHVERIVTELGLVALLTVLFLFY